MPNLYDYMKWRGDLSIEQDGLNDVDYLILSRISYLPFDGIVPEGLDNGVSIAEAAAVLLADGDSRRYIMRADKDLLPAAATCERFRSMLLSGFVNQIDVEKEKQFSAMVISIGNSEHFISYRGTDDSMIGWKEDFNMSFMPQVPAQLEAVNYIEKIAPQLSSLFRNDNLLVGGHSKGGNLAVYASAFCSPKIQKRIARIYNFDGPGFHTETLAQQGFERIGDKICTMLPQSSIVGMLLEYEGEYSIVQSLESGYMQHDMYTWEVMGKELVLLDTVTNSSRFIDRTLKTWLADMNTEQRAAFIEGLYGVINATNSRNLGELSARKWYEHAIAMVKALINLDEHTRMVLGKTLLALAKVAKDNFYIYQGKDNGALSEGDMPRNND